jgi:4-alpha-glucanotransferase
MRFPRSSGVLLHPTSLPGRFGIGDLGPDAYHLIDALVEGGQSIWQVLPLGPTGYGDSPYQCFSAFAGNPLLISPEILLYQGHLEPGDLAAVPAFPEETVDFGTVIGWKLGVLNQAYRRFHDAGGADDSGYRAFCQRSRVWLDDYALFMALKDHYRSIPWTMWDAALAQRHPDALVQWRERLAPQVDGHKYLQYQFYRQWTALHNYAKAQGVRIVGDIPIFVAHDSADVWSSPDLFYLDARGKPTVVAGVPPDYFSDTGQLWGNPLYRWDRLAATGYQWWISRFSALLEMVDIIRLDHFRGFEAYWEVPATEVTAVKGQWVKAPGGDLFAALQRALGDLPIIAEDLGVITPEVEALRDAFGFPGMRVLQFAFGSDCDNPFLPHNYIQNCVAYTGTHDNDTSLGWFQTGTQAERLAALAYCGSDGTDIGWVLIRWLLSSVADTTIVPLQDILGLSSDARMNYPSRLGGNWSWRMKSGALTHDVLVRLRRLNESYGRLPRSPAAGKPV